MASTNMAHAMQVAPRKQPKTTFASLPQDVIVEILRSSPDFDTLLAALASGRAFLNAFKSAPTSIPRSIVTRDVDSAILPSAIFIALARGAPSLPWFNADPIQTLRDVRKLLDRQRDEAFVREYKWTIGKGIAAIQFHSIIDQLARRFATYHLSWLARVSGREQKAASDTELARIKRALYRFEAYCALLPPFHRDLDNGEAFPFILIGQYAFLGQASPWENEQLFAVHESLWRLIVPGTYCPESRNYCCPGDKQLTKRSLLAFNHVALHDIAWGKTGISYVTDVGDGHTQKILSRGIHGILDIDHHTGVYDRCYRLVGGGTDRPQSATFLHDALTFYNEALLHAEQKTLTACGIEPGTPPTLFRDPDAGPENFWRWSHPLLPDDQLPWRMAGEERYNGARDCGCFFWDEARLKDAGIMADRSWEAMRDSHFFATEDEVEEYAPDIDDEERSRNVRSELYDRGIRGYYEWPFDAGFGPFSEAE